MHKFSLRRRHDEDEPRRRRSYANITATLALVFALGGGTAWAAHSYLITSTHQIKPSVLKTLRGNRGPRGFAGLTGAAGSAGANGAAGAAGAAGAQGIPGATGHSHIITWSVNNVVTGSGGASGPGVVVLATVGPFTILGKCTVSAGIYYAQTYMRTNQAGSAEDDYHQSSYPVFGPTTTDTATLQPGGTAVPGDVEIGYQADTIGTGSHQAFFGPNDGSAAAFSADGNTYINSFEGTGVEVGGATASAPCSFNGYVESNAVS